MLENRTEDFLDRRRRGDKSTRLGYPLAPHIPKDLRCSSLFRLLPDASDILFAHVTWDGFTALGPRIFKHYLLPTPAEGHRHVYFSSSPALLSSVDDFYIVLSQEDDEAQLAVIETTKYESHPAHIFSMQFFIFHLSFL